MSQWRGKLPQYPQLRRASHLGVSFSRVKNLFSGINLRTYKKFKSSKDVVFSRGSPEFASYTNEMSSPVQVSSSDAHITKYSSISSSSTHLTKTSRCAKSDKSVDSSNYKGNFPLFILSFNWNLIILSIASMHNTGQQKCFFPKARHVRAILG